jgi:hypothetical protein
MLGRRGSRAQRLHHENATHGPTSTVRSRSTPAARLFRCFPAPSVWIGPSASNGDFHCHLRTGCPRAGGNGTIVGGFRCCWRFQGTVVSNTRLRTWFVLLIGLARAPTSQPNQVGRWDRDTVGWFCGPSRPFRGTTYAVSQSHAVICRSLSKTNGSPRQKKSTHPPTC